MARPLEHPTDPPRSPRGRERIESEGFLGRRGKLAGLGPGVAKHIAAGAGFAILEGAQSTLAKERGVRC